MDDGGFYFGVDDLLVKIEDYYNFSVLFSGVFVLDLKECIKNG